jgi:hypothetical protein
LSFFLRRVKRGGNLHFVVGGQVGAGNRQRLLKSVLHVVRAEFRLPDSPSGSVVSAPKQTNDQGAAVRILPTFRTTIRLASEQTGTSVSPAMQRTEVNQSNTTRLNRDAVPQQAHLSKVEELIKRAMKGEI